MRDTKGGVDPAGDTAECGEEPTGGSKARVDPFPHARIEGRCDTDVRAYKAVAATAWVVDTGASSDSVPGLEKSTVGSASYDFHGKWTYDL